MDVERTRSIWITHASEFTPEQFLELYDAAEAEISMEALRQAADESLGMRHSLMRLGESLNLSPGLLRRWKREDSTAVRYGDVLDHIVDHLCRTRGFRRLVPTAVAVRYGHEVLSA